MTDITELMEERAAGYGALRQSSLTAIALDRGREEIERLRAEVADLKSNVVAFAGPWAAQYSRTFGLPKDHLHPAHYDLLERCGARMDSFKRAALRGQG